MKAAERAEVTARSEAAVAEAKERDRGQQWLRGEATLVDSRFGARTLGDMALLDVGCTAWARREGPDMRLAHDGEARGGIILAVTDAPEVDIETGAVEQVRAVRVWNFYAAPGDYRSWSTLTEAQVDLASCEAPDMAVVRRVYRRFAAEVASRTGTASMEEIDLMVHGARLAALVGGEVRR